MKIGEVETKLNVSSYMGRKLNNKNGCFREENASKSENKWK